MLRRKIRERLTARIFLITFLILLGAGGITFGLIVWATPTTYTSVFNDDLRPKLDDLAGRLAQTEFEASGPILDGFIRAMGVDAWLLDSRGDVVDTPSELALRSSDPVEGLYITTTVGGDSVVSTEEDQSVYTEGTNAEDTEAVVGTAESWSVAVVSDTHAASAEVTFADRTESYELQVTPHVQAENQAVKVLGRIAPWLLAVLLAFSALCALVYSRYITKPIVRMSGIAGKLAELDFGWRCREERRDEIGALGRSLNQMAQKLDTALKELNAANEALRGEMEQERELERQRLAFFSAASHELKTPVTILKGQIAGMLDGVGVYRDRDKYLARSLQVTGRMEGLIQELLTVSRIEGGGGEERREAVDLSGIIRAQLGLDSELLAQRGLRLSEEIAPGLTVEGEKKLLAKAVGCLLTNAALYSPEGAEVRVRASDPEGRPTLTIENTGVHISPEALPHLFEAFYREEQSRNRRTGGSGLGLYLARMILDRHRAECQIENSEEGVLVTVGFPCA